jgi:methylmalonyl-CoA mutase
VRAFAPLHPVMSTPFTLADGFAEPDLSAWTHLAQKALKGASLDRLTAHTYDNVAIQPLYTASDVSAAPHHAPAQARDPFLPWDIRQGVLNPDPVSANVVALYDLERGVSSIEYVIDATGACGIIAQSEDDFSCLTKGIMLDLACVAICAQADPLGSARHLANAIPSTARATAKLAFNLDPMAQIMVGGGDLSQSDALAFAQEVMTTFPAATALRADARAIHEGGGSECQELAVMIAAGISYLKAGQAIGMTPAAINETLLFTLSVGPDVVLEIAKLKAARRVWERVLAACDVVAPMALQAVTSGRMQTIADPWTNILRATCAAFGAGAGGADIVTVLPFTSAYAVADEAPRRIARNTQLILQEESHLGTVADPAAGAWAMEAISDDLARVAWGLVQDIERAGGLEAALGAGLVQGWVATTRTARERDVARRKTALVGVSIFPNLGETLPRMEAAAHPHPKAGSIAPMRLAAPFEAMRLGTGGKIFLATLGPIATFNARSGFARNAFEAGGIKTFGGDDEHSDEDALIAAFTLSNAQIACICGDDATYEVRASHVAGLLKAAGAKAVWVAGKGSFVGVDRTIFAGADILAELTAAHQILEGVA